MSVLAPHIRVLRAEAAALHAEAKTLDGCTDSQNAAAFVLVGMATAKLAAAEQLEAEVRELGHGLVIIPPRASS